MPKRDTWQSVYARHGDGTACSTSGGGRRSRTSRTRSSCRKAASSRYRSAGSLSLSQEWDILPLDLAI